MGPWCCLRSLWRSGGRGGTRGPSAREADEDSEWLGFCFGVLVGLSHVLRFFWSSPLTLVQFSSCQPLVFSLLAFLMEMSKGHKLTAHPADRMLLAWGCPKPQVKATDKPLLIHGSLDSKHQIFAANKTQCPLAFGMLSLELLLLTRN